jgi:hypothetical protein
LKSNKVVILATEGLTTNLLYNELLLHFDHVHVIIENKVSKRKILNNRARKLGWFNVFGQVLFILIVPNWLSLFSKKRIQELLRTHSLTVKSIPENVKYYVESVNTPKLLDLLNELQPSLIFVNGTRIISQRIIENIDVDLLNIHAGITPKYRGVHGGYWAMFNQNSELFGVTFHKVDKGIDTGNIIDQKIIVPSAVDNFITYPVLQFSEGISLLRKYLTELKSESVINNKALTEESNLFFHPTILQYLWKRLFYRVR